MTAASVTRGPKPARPCCPRCGYDLQGTVSAWIASCPLDGTCTECGLAFEWRFVAGAVRLPDWCVERLRVRRLDWIPRTFRTLARSLRPWSFWSSLQMHHEVRWARIAVYLTFLVALSWVALSLFSGAAVLANQVIWQIRGVPAPISWDDILWTTLLPTSPWPDWDWAQAWIVPSLILLVHVGCAVGFLALPISRRQAKVRWAHIARVVAYGAGLLVLPLWGVLIGMAISSYDESLGNTVMWTSAIVATYGLVPIEIAWWSAATGRYLKMRHAWGVGAAVAMMSALVVMLAVVSAHLLLGWPA